MGRSRAAARRTPPRTPRRRIESSTPTFARAHSPPRRDARVVPNPRRPPPGRSARASARNAPPRREPPEAPRTPRRPGARAPLFSAGLRERAPGERSPNARSRPLLLVVVVLRLRRRLGRARRRRRLRSPAVSRRRGVRAFAGRERAEILSVHVYVVCISETVHATFRGVDGGAAEMEPVSRPGLDDSALGDALPRSHSGVNTSTPPARTAAMNCT